MGRGGRIRDRGSQAEAQSDHARARARKACEPKAGLGSKIRELEPSRDELEQAHASRAIFLVLAIVVIMLQPSAAHTGAQRWGNVSPTPLYVGLMYPGLAATSFLRPELIQLFPELSMPK